MSWFEGTRARLRLLFSPHTAESRMDEEMRFHVEMEAERLVREEGLKPEEARRRAFVAFGGVEKYREELRDGRGLAWLSGLSLDFKLGFRMLRKYPGLTLVGGLALSVALGLAAAWFEFGNDFVNPTLPLEDGERIVAIRNWDAAAAAPERRSIHDFVAWREHARSVENLGAYIEREHNLITEDGWAEPAQVAEISASAFRLVRISPLLGRPLVEADEHEGAPPAVVIGYDLWQNRFGGDPEVVGRMVRLGNNQATVVGVMPEGFAFPVNHSLWVPLRIEALVSDYQRGQGPAIRTFGRLAPGVTLDEAQAELTTIGLRAATDFPETNGHLRPQVLRYVDSFIVGAAAMHATNAVFLMIVIVICANVAALVFARTATRVGEITVRTALGAPRSRILMQLFVEGLVLVFLSAVVALAVVKFGMTWGMDVFFAVQGGATPPFWWDDSLAPATVLYVAALSFLAAVLVGVLPALKATGGRVQPGLQRLGVGSSSMRFGGIWTAVIIVQVALSVAFLPTAVVEASTARGARDSSTALPADEYLTARMAKDSEASPEGSTAVDGWDQVRLGGVHAELKQRLALEPGVTAVAMATRLPGMDHPIVRVELEGVAAADGSGPRPRVHTASVDADFFDAFDLQFLEGRAFRPADLEADKNVVVVNRAFVQRFFGGTTPIGRRVRFISRPGASPSPWHEIAGVVEDAAVSTDITEDAAAIYRTLVPGSVSSVQIAIRVRSEPEAFAPRLRASALAVDPTLRLYDIRPLSEIAAAEQRMYKFFALVFALVAAATVILSTAGVYALVSFTVSQRTREIGIRSALGAQPGQIVAAIFSRSIAQVGLGVVMGVLLALRLADRGLADRTSDVTVLVPIAALMMTVGVAACVVPAWRALRIQPTEALRAGG